jgi:hypothetical protein
MFTRFLLAATLLTLAVGCAKKSSKYTGRADDTAAPPAEKPTAGNADKAKPEEKPNWIKPRPPDGVLPADAPGGGKPPWVANPPAPGGSVPPLSPGNPGGQPMPAVVPPPMVGVPAPIPPQPAAPVTPTTPAVPAGKAVTKADMNEVWIFIENFSQANQGKMPPPEWTYAALVAAKSPAADLVKGGYIILTGKPTRESVWAFERNAQSQGGWIASQNGPEQVTAADFARRIRE